MSNLPTLKQKLIIIEIFLLLLVVFFIAATSTTLVDKFFAGLLTLISILNTLAICLENRSLLRNICIVRIFILIFTLAYFAVIITSLNKQMNSGVSDFKDIGDELIKAGFVCVMFMVWIGMSSKLVANIPRTPVHNIHKPVGTVNDVIAES